MKIMKKNSSEDILMLQYRIKRYQAKGNGAYHNTVMMTIHTQLHHTLQEMACQFNCFIK